MSTQRPAAHAALADEVALAIRLRSVCSSPPRHRDDRDSCTAVRARTPGQSGVALERGRSPRRPGRGSTPRSSVGSRSLAPRRRSPPRRPASYRTQWPGDEDRAVARRRDDTVLSDVSGPRLTKRPVSGRSHAISVRRLSALGRPLRKLNAASVAPPRDDRSAHPRQLIETQSTSTLTRVLDPRSIAPLEVSQREL